MSKPWRRLLIFILSCLPLAWLIWATLQQQLGADPAKTIVLLTGQWTFYALLVTLAVTPLKKLLGWRWLMPQADNTTISLSIYNRPYTNRMAIKNPKGTINSRNPGRR